MARFGATEAAVLGFKVNILTQYRLNACEETIAPDALLPQVRSQVGVGCGP